MQSVSSRILTRVAVSISYDDNHYTTDTSSHLGVVAIKKGASGSPATTVTNITYAIDWN